MQYYMHNVHYTIYNTIVQCTRHLPHFITVMILHYTPSYYSVQFSSYVYRLLIAPSIIDNLITIKIPQEWIRKIKSYTSMCKKCFTV